MDKRLESDLRHQIQVERDAAQNYERQLEESERIRKSNEESFNSRTIAIKEGAMETITQLEEALAATRQRADDLQADNERLQQEIKILTSQRDDADQIAQDYAKGVIQSPYNNSEIKLILYTRFAEIMVNTGYAHRVAAYLDTEQGHADFNNNQSMLYTVNQVIEAMYVPDWDTTTEATPEPEATEARYEIYDVEGGFVVSQTFVSPDTEPEHWLYESAKQERDELNSNQ